MTGAARATGRLPPVQSPEVDYDVPALRSAVAVLDVLSNAQEPLGVSDVARLANVPKNMAYRLLVTLTSLGWVAEADERPRYALTAAPFHLFSRPFGRASLTAACQGPLRWLQQQTDETVYVGVPHGHQVLNVMVLDGRKAIRVAGNIGELFDLHCTAHGKVLLAFLDDAWREERLRGPLRRYTPRTITSRRALEAHLAEVRVRGYAVNEEEYGAGLLGVAAPVFDHRGTAVAAIGVFAPLTNTSVEELHGRLAPLVREAARRASGGNPAGGGDG
jgi:DNA-binding IclR family transcriptional regulator